MDRLTAAIREARRTLPLRPRAQFEAEVRQRLDQIMSKEDLDPIEKFAASAARKLLFDLARVRSEADGVALVRAWVRLSLSEGVDERRLVVAQLGSALLCVDFKESHEPGGT